MYPPPIACSGPSVIGDDLILASVTSPVELELIREWLRRRSSNEGAGRTTVLRLPAGKPPEQVLTELTGLLEADVSRTVIPARVLWVPGRLPMRSKVIALLAGRDACRPPKFLQRRVCRRDPSRARVVAGESATVEQLRGQWSVGTDETQPRDFAQFVVRRAVLALERVEYRLLGPEYKSPRLVKPEMLASSRFRSGVDEIPGATLHDAGRILDEMATGWSRLSVDLLPAMGKLILRKGFDAAIDFDGTQVHDMKGRISSHPAVLLFSHRSNLDTFVLTLAMRQNGMPRAHVFGGINMAFGLMGPLMRRSGVIFIRRKIGNDPLYKYVLKEYVGYLVEKRFNLSWSIEGSRSRTGKMLPPKLGLLNYVANAYLTGRSDDILLQPVSISFDQLHETKEYAAYARGSAKAPEGARWFYAFIKAQRERHYGTIYVRFPEAISMRNYLGPSDDSITLDEASRRLAMHKMSLEVAWRILRATPVNATGLVSALLLSTKGLALTLDQLHHTLHDLLDYLERNQTPTTESARQLRTHNGVRAAVESLAGGHPVTAITSGTEPVWYIAPEHQHQAAFYRNTVIHAFLETSVVQLALAFAARTDSNRLQAFWAQTARLRDLLKFEFYFADSHAFRRNITEEMAWHPQWERDVAAGGSGIEQLMRSKRPLTAATVLRPFFEAYTIVADVLRTQPPLIDAEHLTKRSLAVGRQYVAQGRVSSDESVSALLFVTACQVATDQGLLDPTAGVDARRAAFCKELRAILRDLDTVESLAAEQFAEREARRR